MPSLGLKKQRKVGSVGDALLIQWRALKAAEAAMYKAGEMGNAGGVISGVHAVTQASQGFAKLVETAELQAQIDELKAELQVLRGDVKLRKVV